MCVTMVSPKRGLRTGSHALPWEGESKVAAVYPRRRGAPRPSYLPTAVVERLTRPVLPSDTLSEWERRKLEGRGIDRDFLDSLMPDVVRVRMALPAVPVPETPLRNFKPPKREPV